MTFTALGFIQPATGAILQEGIDVLVILNAWRVSGIMRDEHIKRFVEKEK
jgi:cation transport ATPase